MAYRWGQTGLSLAGRPGRRVVPGEGLGSGAGGRSCCELVKRQTEPSRVRPRTRNRSNRSLNAQWVEITNNTRHAVNLDGWTLQDEDGHRYHFNDVRLAGRSTIRIHTGEGRDTRTDLFQDRRNYVWDNRSDTATLRDDRGRTVDTESWGHRHRR
ncbi:lamin tail domain-containing protein [Streptomyces sp. NBC_00090]|uniref:lamin tail domain-containing protein n=1 Tax=Streptomyces sp. NBC_00090 TaxID=2903619 RepID=UPI003870BF9C